jgi:tetratricopeptide (TPR) repeat protein
MSTSSWSEGATAPLPARAMTRALTAVLLFLALAACTAAGSDQEALQRGDEAFARGEYTEALAEYRLVLRQNENDVDILLRTAHAFASVGRIDEAVDLYRRAVELDHEAADLAAADLLRVARRATDGRRDGIMAAAAVEAALELRPGVNLTGLARPLAEHFARNGQFGQALPYFQKAMGETEPDPNLILDLARAHEELGDCELALTYLDRVQDDVPILRRSEVDWRVGHCSFELGMEAVEAGRADDALELFQATIEVGEPRNRLAPAWFEAGEILADQGRCQEAIAAFEVAQQEELGGGLLIQRARDRVDDIRFRRGSGGPC